MRGLQMERLSFLGIHVSRRREKVQIFLNENSSEEPRREIKDNFPTHKLLCASRYLTRNWEYFSNIFSRFLFYVILLEVVESSFRGVSDAAHNFHLQKWVAAKPEENEKLHAMRLYINFYHFYGNFLSLIWPSAVSITPISFSWDDKVEHFLKI